MNEEWLNGILLCSVISAVTTPMLDQKINVKYQQALVYRCLTLPPGETMVLKTGDIVEISAGTARGQ
jgi:hypothetical protein